MDVEIAKEFLQTHLPSLLQLQAQSNRTRNICADKIHSTDCAIGNTGQCIDDA
ncbi:hypothetical protein [Mycoavidus sp. SF9855]|uniref:hypothetical protein n=1 Tax=Mycoavidus sp. SF9855 TaxID=2968475 RepID=UPI0034D1A81E